MIRNEKGFSYPLTFCVILLAFVVLTIHFELYVSEKRIIKESVTMLKQEYYFLSAMQWTEELFFKEDHEEVSGIYSFSDGEVNYHSVKVTDSLYRVTFTLAMRNLPEITGFGYYDKELKKMIKWNEKN